MRGDSRSRWPLVATAACATAGFAAMALLSLTAARAPDGRSMWTYWSGTLGDLVLPGIIYGLTRTCTALGPDRISPGSYAAAALGATAGAASQASWLLDPSPRLNWLLVAPHTFSFPGWYHAGYLTLTSGYVAGTAWEGLRRMGMAPDDRLRTLLGGRGAAAMAAACGIFTLTVVADSLPSAGTSASASTIAVTVAAPVLLTALAAWRLGRSAGLLVRPVGCGLAATGICAIVIAAGK
jgi:hypothetical protein